MKLSVLKICGESRVFRKDGERLRREIERRWSSRGAIEVDFGNIRIASVSFLDEAIAVLALRLTLEEIRKRLRVTNITEPDRRLLNDLVLARSRERDALYGATGQG